MAPKSGKQNKVSTEKGGKDVTSKPLGLVKSIGYENSKDLLDEINHRLSLINKFNIMLKKVPKSLTRTSLKDLIPEMITSRLPGNPNGSYVFIQFANEAAVDKYIEILNKKVVFDKKLVAQKLSFTPKTNIDDFDLSALYFNGLKPETTLREIKSLYPNATIELPMGPDHLAIGSVVLRFASEQEAMSAFIENKMSLHGLKCHLTFFMKTHQPSPARQFTFDKPEEILAEIKSRFEAHNRCSAIIKGLPAAFTLHRLRQLAPSMSNCKINADKKIGFVDYPSAELADSSTKELNGKMVDGRKIRAFVLKESFPCSDLSSVNTSKLHLTNLLPAVTVGDVKALFPNGASVDLHQNTDGSCIGSATITFANCEQALKAFTRESVAIRSAPVQINFHIDAKVTDMVPKKRALDDDSEQSDTGVAKKQKADGITTQKTDRKSNIAKLMKPSAKEQKVTIAPTAAVESNGIAGQKKALKRPAPVVAAQEEKTTKIVERKIVAPKSTKVVAAKENKLDKVAKPTSSNVNAKDDKKKPVKSVAVERKPVVSNNKSAKQPVSEKDTKKKPEVVKNVLPAKPMKRKLDQDDVDLDQVETPKKSRRMVKSATGKEKQMNFKSRK